MWVIRLLRDTLVICCCRHRRRRCRITVALWASNRCRLICGRNKNRREFWVAWFVSETNAALENTVRSVSNALWMDRREQKKKEQNVVHLHKRHQPSECMRASSAYIKWIFRLFLSTVQCACFAYVSMLVGFFGFSIRDVYVTQFLCEKCRIRRVQSCTEACVQSHSFHGVVFHLTRDSQKWSNFHSQILIHRFNSSLKWCCTAYR